MVRPDFLKPAARAEEQKHSLAGMCKSAASALGNFIIPTAEAAQIARCVGPCAAKKWGDCLKCLGNAAPVIIVKKAWCRVKFIAVLA